MSRSPRAAAHLAAWPVALLGVALAVSGVLYVLEDDPYGWFGVACGVVLAGLAVVALVLRDWALVLFGGLFVLSASSLLIGIAAGSDLFMAVGLGALVVVGCAAALTHLLARLVE